MEYKQLIKEYFDNVGIDNEKSRDLRLARTDFINTLKVMYGKTKFPKKTYCEEFDATHLIIEDFADTTFITGLTTSIPDTQVISGQLVMNVDGTITYENNLNDLDEISFELFRVGAPVTAIQITVSIDNQLGENLFLVKIL